MKIDKENFYLNLEFIGRVSEKKVIHLPLLYLAMSLNGFMVTVLCVSLIVRFGKKHKEEK